MLLESRIDDATTLFIDAETAGGFAKDDDASAFRPDDALDHVARVATLVARRLAGAAAEVGLAGELEVSFGVKVQGDALVCLAKTPEDGQFRVTVRARGR